MFWRILLVTSRLGVCYLNEDGTVDSDDLLIVINGWGVCDAGESSAMGGGGSGEQDIWETLQQLPGLPPEVLEMIQELLGV